MRSFPAFTLVLLLFSAICVQGARVPAALAGPEDQRRAEELFARSETMYQAGDFRGAIALLEEANRLSPHPVLVYNLARAHESLGENEQAVVYYRRYLEMDPDAADKGAVMKRIDTLTRAREVPPDGPPPGKGDTPETPPTTAPSSPSPVPWIVAGVGVLGIGAGGVLGGLALGKHADAEDPAVDGAETEALAASADDLALGASIAFVAGGVVAAAGIVWGIADVVGSGEPTKVSVGVSPNGVVVRGAF